MTEVGVETREEGGHVWHKLSPAYWGRECARCHEVKEAFKFHDRTSVVCWACEEAVKPGRVVTTGKRVKHRVAVLDEQGRPVFGSGT